jgi:hypothetical protein
LKSINADEQGLNRGIAKNFKQAFVLLLRHSYVPVFIGQKVIKWRDSGFGLTIVAVYEVMKSWRNYEKMNFSN